MAHHEPARIWCEPQAGFTSFDSRRTKDSAGDRSASEQRVSLIQSRLAAPVSCSLYCGKKAASFLQGAIIVNENYLVVEECVQRATIPPL
jgi:hypothetical protein